MDRGLYAVLRIGADDGRVRTEPEQLARFAPRVDQIAQGKDAIEPVRQEPVQGLNIWEQMARLDAGDDAERCEAWHVGLVDQFRVLDAEGSDSVTA
jgi:hypothetical protein